MDIIKVSDKRRKPFTMIENEILDTPHLDVYQKMTYIALCRFSYSQSNCNPTVPTIAKVVGCKPRKIQRVFKELVELKLISIKYRRNGKTNLPNEYTIHNLPDELMEGGVPQTPGGGVPQTPGWCTTDTRVVYHRHQGGVPQTPKEESFKESFKDNDNDDIATRLFDYFSKNLPHFKNVEIRNYLIEFVLINSFNKELIVEACNRAAIRGQAHNFVYIKKILENFQKSGVVSINDLTRYDEQYVKSKQKPGRKKKLNTNNHDKFFSEVYDQRLKK